MESLNNQTLEIFAIVGWIAAIVMALAYFSGRARRRAAELQTAAAALQGYYEAVDAVADDPALPTGALEMLVGMSEIIGDPNRCARVTTNSLIASANGERPQTPTWQTEVESVGRHRPDLVENFNRAISNGIIVIFNRWPGNAWKGPALVRFMNNRQREAAFADRIVHSAGDDRNLAHA